MLIVHVCGKGGGHRVRRDEVASMGKIFLYQVTLIPRACALALHENVTQCRTGKKTQPAVD